MGGISLPEIAVSVTASKVVYPILETTRTCYAVNHLLKSVVREIRTLRSVGAESGRPLLRPGGVW